MRHALVLGSFGFSVARDIESIVEIVIRILLIKEKLEKSSPAAL
jgi:hypothetical protein